MNVIYVKEEWKAIKDYEGIYEISNLGRIRSLERILPSGITRKRATRKPTLGKRGYYYVVLYNNIKPITKKIHILVAEAFIGSRPEGHVINHRDCNKQNNIVHNLEYVTPSQNSWHALKSGRVQNAKLNNDMVIEIKEKQHNHTVSDLAKEYNVHETVIRSTLKGKAWRHASNLEKNLNDDVEYIPIFDDWSKEENVQKEEHIQEEWRPVVGFENAYMVSNLGNIYSMPRIVYGRRIGGRLLKLNKRGMYLFVNLCLNKETTLRMVHSVVAEAFIGPQPKNLFVNHKNGQKLDNRVKNLEYITPSDNIRHAYDIGLMPRGENFYKAKLKNKDVIEIISKRNDYTPKELARQYGVGRSAIYSILSGRSWKHLLSPTDIIDHKPRAKLKDEDVIDIRNKRNDYTTKELSLQYGVSRSTINNILSGKRRYNVPS